MVKNKDGILMIPENLIDYDKVYNPYRTSVSKLTIRERFFLYVKKQDKENGCWKWIGGKSGKANTPEFGIFYKPVLAQRVSYAMHRDDFDPLMSVRSFCGNRLCVNPDHLECYYGCSNGNYKNFVKDMFNHPFYSRSNGVFLTLKQLRKRENYLIKKLNDIGISYSQLAEVFNVDQSSIGKILTDEVNPRGRGKRYYRNILNKSFNKIFNKDLPVNLAKMNIATLFKLYKEDVRDEKELSINKEQKNVEGSTNTSNIINIWGVDIVIDNLLPDNKIIAETEMRFKENLKIED